MKIADIIQNTHGDQYIFSRDNTVNILDKSVLIVSESEQAVFIRDGVIVQTFGSGRHMLTTATHPVLFGKQKKLTGGKGISSTSVIFVRTSNLTEIKWGTESPIPMFDAKYGFSVNVRANGTYSIKINEAEKVLIKLLGLDVGSITKQQFSSYFRGVFLLHVKDRIANYMKENKLSVMEMCTEYLTVSASIKDALKKRYDEYGVSLIDFTINGISIPENDPYYQKINNAIAENSIIGIQGDNWEKISKKEIYNKVASDAHIGFLGIGSPRIDLGESQSFCKNCGKKITAEARFCPYCGNNLEK